MNLSELINEILSEWAYRCDDGMPNPKNPTHLKELGDVLSEMGLSHIKNTLVENLLMEKGKTPERVKEAEGSFTNPILNKKIKYKNTKGEDAEGIVGNLLRLPAEHPGRKAAEALLPADDSPERDAINKDLGGQGQAAKPEDGKDKKGGEEAGGGEEEKAKAAQAMFDPKNDPAMAARMDTEKEVQAKLAKDAEAEKELEKEQEPKKEDEFAPIDSKDVAKEMPQADPETFNGDSDIPDGIDPKDLEKFNTDISKVKQIVDDAKAKGEKAPDINLCDITVAGTNLYCDDNLGIPRDQMPQFKGKPQPGTPAADMEIDKNGEVDTEPLFKKMLEEKGIKVVQTEIPSDKLKATQKDLVGAKVVGMMGALEENPEHPSITAPIYVSRDGYVIDGHHRWAAIAAYNAKYPDKQIPMKVQVIDQDIKDAIPMCNKFAEEQGVAAKKADANKEAPTGQPSEKEPTNDDPNSKVKTVKGKASGEEIQTMEMEGGGFVYGTKHGNTAMVDDIIDDVKSKIPKERWGDIVFVGEGGATNDDTGEIEFNDEMKYAAPKFKEFGAGIDTWDGDDMDVHNSESKLYQKQKEKTGLNDNQILAGNWASMIGQGEGQGLDPNDPDNNMKAEDYLDDDGKQFLQDAAKEAGLPPIENFDNPTGEKPSEENGWKGTGDRGTLYRLSFPGDNGDKETKINDIQVAFNDARDEHLIEKNKELTAQGKIPITIAGESHVDLVDKMTRKAKQTSPTTSSPSTPTSAPKLTDKVKQKISNWTEKEKAFFDRNEGAPGSKERRSLGQALKDKAAGALKAIKKGAKHEVEEFKEAGKGVQNFFSGKPLSEKEQKAVKAVAFKVVTTAVFGAAFGGLSHGVAAFGKHVAMEFIPHIIGETILKGVGKAAVFADAEGEAEMDRNILKFTEMIAKGLEEMEITDEMMEQMVDSYNEKKENGEVENETPTVKEEHLHLVDELMLEMIYGFIDEIKPKSKQFQAISKKSGKVSDFDSEEARDAAVKKGTHTDVDGNDKSDTQPAQTGNMYKDDPEYQKRTAAETPPTGKKKKSKKNKELDQTKNTKSEFNKGNLSKDGVSDEEFAANKKAKPTPNQIKVEQIQKFFLDKNGNTKFPKKYLKVLARMLSTKPGGVTISDFTDVSGAGTLSSTMGELLTLMAVTIKDDNEAKEFFNMIRQHVKANGKESIIDIGWVNSAEKVRKAQFARYDRKFGKGNWELDNMAWDVEGEVEALGMENYKQNKGFSTDVYAKVKVNGKYVLDEISLKKEIKANLLNATSGRVADIMVRGAASDEDLKIYDDLNAKIDALMGLKDAESIKEKKKLIAQRDAIVEKYNVNVPDDVKVSKVQKVQRELHEKFVKNGVGEISGFLKKFCNKKDAKDKKYRSGALDTMVTSLNQKDDYKPKVNAQLDALCSVMPKGGFKTAEDYNKALKEVKIGDTSDVQKLNMALMSAIGAENPNSQAAKSAKLIIKNSHNHSKAVREFLLKDPVAKKGLLMSIREALPLKALFEGEENMILADVSIDDDVLKDVFGVDSFEELEQKLTVRDTPPPPCIVYRVAGPDGSNTDIPVAEIVSRPDGIGYGGSWKLIMAVHPDFAKKLKESNDRLNNK